MPRNRRTLNLGSSWIEKQIKFEDFSTSELGSPACSECEETNHSISISKWDKDSKHLSLNQNELNKNKSKDETKHYEDKRKPFYVPRKPSFFLHDLRIMEQEEGQQDNNVDDGIETKCWKHDKYNEEEQQPKSRKEIVDSYGYDIRSENPNKYTKSRHYSNKQGTNGSYIGKSSGRYKSDDRQPQDYNLNQKKKNKLSFTKFSDKPIKQELYHKNVKTVRDASPEILSINEEALCEEINDVCVGDDNKASKSLPNYSQTKNLKNNSLSRVFPNVPLKKPSPLEKIVTVQSNKGVFSKNCEYGNVSNIVVNVDEKKTKEKQPSPLNMSNLCISKDCKSVSILKHFPNQSQSRIIQNTNTDKHNQFYQQVILKADAPACEFDYHGSSSSFEAHPPLNLDKRQNIVPEDCTSYGYKNHGLSNRVHSSSTMHQNVCESYEMYNDLFNYSMENANTFSFPDPPDVTANHLSPWVLQQHYLPSYYQQDMGSSMNAGCYAYHGCCHGSSVAIMKPQFVHTWSSPTQQICMARQGVTTDPIYIPPNNVHVLNVKMSKQTLSIGASLLEDSTHNLEQNVDQLKLDINTSTDKENFDQLTLNIPKPEETDINISILLSLFSKHQIKEIIYSSPNHFIPDASIMFRIIAIMDNLVARNEKFNIPENPWHPIISRIYFGILFHIQTLRCSQHSKLSTVSQSQFLNDFLNQHPLDSLSIPGPLIPIFQCLSVSDVPFGHYMPVTPHLPELYKSIRFKTLVNFNSDFNWLLKVPNIPVLSEMFHYITTIKGPNEVLDVTASEPFDSSIHRRFLDHDFQAAAWTQTQIAVMSSCSLAYNPYLPPCTIDNFANYNNHLGIPRPSPDVTISSIAEFLLLSSGMHWFSTVKHIMTRYNRLFKDESSLHECSVTGTSSNLLEFTREERSRSFNVLQPRAFNPDLPYSLTSTGYTRTSTTDIPKLDEAISKTAQILTTYNVINAQPVQFVNITNNGAQTTNGPYFKCSPMLGEIALFSCHQLYDTIISKDYYLG